MRALVCVVLVLLSCAAPAAAADPARLGRYDPEGLRAEEQASELLQEASLRRDERRPECLQHMSRTQTGDTPITDTAPSLAVRSVIGLFRRPPTARERALAAAPDQPLTFPGTLERSHQGVRLAHTASGEEIVVTVLPRVDRLGFDPQLQQECSALMRKIARRLLRQAPPRVRQEAERALAALPGDGPGVVAEPEIAEAVTVSWRHGGSGGLFDTQRFSVSGTFMSIAGTGKQRGTSRVFGLVPDGVASVELRYPRYVSRGRYRDPADYERRYRRTLRVQENVFAALVPREAGDAFPPRMVWRSAAGTVVRTVERGE